MVYCLFCGFFGVDFVLWKLLGVLIKLLGLYYLFLVIINYDIYVWVVVIVINYWIILK